MLQENLSTHLKFWSHVVFPLCAFLWLFILCPAVVLESLNPELDVPAEAQPTPEIPHQDRHQELQQQQGQEQVISSLRLENQLLRNEVSSLNQEMASLIQRAKDMQEGEPERFLTCVCWTVCYQSVLVRYILL